MRPIALLILVLSVQASFAANVELKAQHALTTTDDLYAVQGTKNSAGKSNILSLVVRDGATSLTAPVLSVSPQVVLLAEKMEPTAAISASATGTVSIAGMDLDFEGDSSGMQVRIFGTPPVGSGALSANLDCCCAFDCDDQSSSSWTQCVTVTNESFFYFPENIETCIAESGLTPYIRARRDGILSAYRSVPL